MALSLGGVLAAGILLRAEGSEHRLTTTGPGVAPATFAPAPPPEAAVGDVVAGLGPTFAPEPSFRPTGDTGQSKVWFHDGRWWGLLVAGDEFRIHAFDPAVGWTDTGTLVDPRRTSHADVVSADGTLLVISAGRSSSAVNAVELRRYSYDAADRLYRPDRQFPIRISDIGARSVSISRSSNGTLWAAFVTDQQLEVAHTLSNDRSWTAPQVIPIPGAAQSFQSASIATDAERVVVLGATTTGAVFAATTTTGDAWSARQVIGGGEVDVTRTVSLREGLDGGPRFLAVTDVAPTLDGETNPLAPHIVVLASSDGATWSTHAVGRVEDGLRDPILVIDESDRSAVVLAVAEGSVRMKRAALDHLVFPSGRGVVLLPADTGALFEEPTSARRVQEGQGLVVLASDGGAGRYGYAAVDVPPVVEDTGRSTGATLLSERFDSRAAAAGPPPGWQLSSDAGSGDLSLATGIDGLGLRLRSASPGGARACRRFVVPQPVPLTVSLAVRFTGGGSGDAVVASLRGRAETASIRVDDDGRPAWFDGETKATGTGAMTPATWYRVDVRIEPDGRRYGFSMRSADGTVIAEADGLHWRSAEARFPEQVCVETREGTGADVTVDEVEVRR